MDIGWGELLVIGIVALIVIGPKDLPRLFHTLGRFTAKARAMGREFQRAMDEAARESGVQEASADMKAMLSKKSLGLDRVEAAARKFESWDPLKNEAPKPPAPAPGSETAGLAEARAAAAAGRSAASVAPQTPAATAADTTPSAGAAVPAPASAAPAPRSAPASAAGPQGEAGSGATGASEAAPPTSRPRASRRQT